MRSDALTGMRRWKVLAGIILIMSLNVLNQLPSSRRTHALCAPKAPLRTGVSSYISVSDSTSLSSIPASTRWPTIHSSWLVTWTAAWVRGTTNSSSVWNSQSCRLLYKRLDAFTDNAMFPTSPGRCSMQSFSTLRQLELLDQPKGIFQFLLEDIQYLPLQGSTDLLMIQVAHKVPVVDGHPKVFMVSANVNSFILQPLHSCCPYLNSFFNLQELPFPRLGIIPNPSSGNSQQICQRLVLRWFLFLNQKLRHLSQPFLNACWWFIHNVDHLLIKFIFHRLLIPWHLQAILYFLKDLNQFNIFHEASYFLLAFFTHLFKTESHFHSSILQDRLLHRFLYQRRNPFLPFPFPFFPFPVPPRFPGGLRRSPSSLLRCSLELGSSIFVFSGNTGLFAALPHSCIPVVLNQTLCSSSGRTNSSNVAWLHCPWEIKNSMLFILWIATSRARRALFSPTKSTIRASVRNSRRFLRPMVLSWFLARYIWLR